MVTGASGFMGTHMVRLLLEQGATVVATDLCSGSIMSPATTDRSARVEPLPPCDLREAGTVATLFKALGDRKIDQVFHIAGLFDYAASFSDLIRANVDGSVNLVEALGELPTKPRRLVYWAAGGVYDFERESPAKEPTREQLLGVDLRYPGSYYPTSGYLRSKLYAEQELHMRGDRVGIPVTSIRPGGVYGPGSRYGVALAIRIAARGGLGRFYIGPQWTRAGMVHVEDVCRAALFLSRHPKAAGEVYNVNDDSAYTTSHLMRACAEHLGFPMVPGVSLPMGVMKLFVRFLAWRADRMGRESQLTQDMVDLQALDALLDASKLKALGWKPRHPDSLLGLMRTIEAYREEGWL
jgi:nucleoside-diphosphate-sugar epimerase